MLADLGEQTVDNVVDAIRKLGVVEKTEDSVPQQATHICFYLDGQWYRLEFEQSQIEFSDPIESLDVALLQSKILTPIFGVGDPRTDSRIGFVGGIRGTEELERLVDSGEKAIAFSMYPTSMSQLIAVSDVGEIMPPKSTWFEPKLRSGLFVHRFERY